MAMRGWSKVRYTHLEEDGVMGGFALCAERLGHTQMSACSAQLTPNIHGLALTAFIVCMPGLPGVMETFMSMWTVDRTHSLTEHKRLNVSEITY